MARALSIASRRRRRGFSRLATYAHPPRARRGFSFTEVLFAVVVLGLGFILIAAMFPITIRQTRSTMDEGQAAGVVFDALATIRAVASDATMPPNQPGLQPFDVGDVGGEQVSTANPAYAWVAFYRRGAAGSDRLAQVFVLVVRARTAAAFGPADFATDPDAVTVLPANLEPRTVGVKIRRGEGGAPDRAFLTGGTAGDATPAAAPGAYLLVADDDVGARAFQLGNPVDEPAGVWELAPGHDLRGSGVTGDGEVAGTAFLVGRGYAEPGKPASGFAGPAQDVSLYTSFIAVRE